MVIIFMKTYLTKSKVIIYQHLIQFHYEGLLCTLSNFKCN